MTKLLACAIAVLALTVGGAQAELRAFPSAYGFGAGAEGGRGGRVIAVTHLDDSGPGSLRDCFDASGPRICIFRVAGTIEVERSLVIANGRLTVAGQTAPGGGVQLRLAPDSEESGPLVEITADDVILRHLRLRRGPTSLEKRPGGTCCGDALLVKDANRVLLDHLSLAFSTDELLDVYSSTNVTIQNSILAYGLDRSTAALTVKEGKGHSKGMLVGYGSDRVSFLNNLVALTQARGCRIKSGTADCRGNFYYGVQHREAVISDGARVNFVNNAVRRPASMKNTANDVIMTNSGGAAYAVGNLLGAGRQLSGEGFERLPEPVDLATIPSSLTAAEVLARAGAWPRDTLDARTVEQVGAGKGRIVNTPEEAGGWPLPAAGEPYADLDFDGMDDVWERASGLNPTNADDRNSDADGDRYTNLQEFLEYSAQAIVTY